ASAFTEAIQLDLPMVIIDRPLQGVNIDSVSIDNVDAAYRLTEHLIADGHRRIGAMFGLDSVTGSQRYQGYVKALKDYGIQPSSDLVIQVNARTEEGYQATKKLLNRPQPPDAILTSNGLLSVGAFRALHESKVAIPDEIGFASFDETGWTTLVTPPITIIEQPTYEIGQTATELLLKRIENPTRPAREIILKANLVVRNSCARHGS
ncbi:MAG: substrate-binding domain-containing protein, partial [Anaerolineae bacterium]|nr:substrate-binding domain-containing protein [Anaerolineae bacterium]